MSRLLIIFLIYFFTISLGALFFSLLLKIPEAKISYSSSIPFWEVFPFTGLISGIYSSPAFIIYLIIFINWKCTHLEFIQYSFYFIGISILIMFVILASLIKDFIPGLLFISYGLSAFITLMAFRKIKGGNTSNK